MITKCVMTRGEDGLMREDLRQHAEKLRDCQEHTSFAGSQEQQNCQVTLACSHMGHVRYTRLSESSSSVMVSYC